MSGTIGYSHKTTLIWLVFILSHAPLRFLGAKFMRDSYRKLYDKAYEYKSLKTKSIKEKRRFFTFRKIIWLAYFVNNLEIIALCFLAVFMYFYFGK